MSQGTYIYPTPHTSTVQVSVFLYHEKMGESISTPPPFSLEVDCTTGKLAQNKTEAFGRSHNNQFQFDRCKILLDGFFFEIVISSFFWTGSPLSEEADAKYC